MAASPTGTGIRIRRASGADVPGIARIWSVGWRDAHLGQVPEELYGHRTDETYPPRARSRLDHTWVAVTETRGEPLGFVIVAGDELEQIYVDRGARGSGVARALLRHAETVIGAGHSRAWLAVVAGNARARAFYEREGWADRGPIDYRAEIEGGHVDVPCRRYEKAVRR